MDCFRCGWCCFIWGGGVRATAEDIKRWEREGRVDILDIFDEDGWTIESQCPFLIKVRGKDEFICGIQDTKPTVCEEWDWCQPSVGEKFQEQIKGKTRPQIIKIAQSLEELYEDLDNFDYALRKIQDVYEETSG